MDTRKNPDRKSNSEPFQSMAVPFCSMKPTRAYRWSHWRPSFTLVELLVAIAIIGVLAGLTLIALAGAQRDAEISRTRATIRKINETIIAMWEEYATRAIPLSLPREAMIPDPTTGTPFIKAREVARIRIIALRDLMRMEMPDRLTDLSAPPVLIRASVPQLPTQNIDIGFLPPPAAWSVYRSRYSPGSVREVYTESAELLYLIVSSSHSENSGGLEGFRSTEIGDVDGDSNPEFLDAWGKPIAWLRWPAGAIDWSETVAKAYQETNNPMVGNFDPLDPVGADWRYGEPSLPAPNPTVAGQSLPLPYPLQPLIFSAGPDRVYNVNIIANGDIDFSFATQTVTLAGESWSYFYPDPFGTPMNLGLGMGTLPFPNLELDITSHDVESDL